MQRQVWTTALVSIAITSGHVINPQIYRRLQRPRDCIITKLIPIPKQARFLRPSSATAFVRPASIDCSGHGTPPGLEDDIVHLPDNSTLKIPVYPDRPNEELATRKARQVFMWCKNHTTPHTHIFHCAHAEFPN